jgi:ribose/xylose/arabinose/galactoside ABC-type transport system permease subunit
MNKIAGILMLLVYVCVGTTLLNDAFVSPFNVQNVVRYTAMYGILGIGVAFVIITGGIDLSIGSVVGLLGCILPLLLKRGWSVPGALACVMGLAVLIGLYHGLLVTKARLQPFIVTLCGLLYYRGLARWLTGDQTQGFGTKYDELRLLAIGKPCSAAFLILLGGVAVLAWSVWRWLHPQQETEARAWLKGPILGTVAGIALVVIGSSRFWYGYEFQTGAPLLSIGTIDVPTWSVRVHPDAVALPQRLMAYAGWGLLPGVLLLAGRLARSGWRTMLAPVTALAAAGLLVYQARTLVAQPDGWFWPDADWARTWRMLAVFGTLAALMVSLAWFGRRALRVSAGEAAPALMLCGLSGMLWLLGQTPLGQTLVPAPMIFLLVIAALGAVFLNQTIYGRYLLALGRNEEAARYSGIRTDRMVVLAYVLCSFIAGIGAVLFALDGNSVQPSGHGTFLELYAIAAAVLGGCSLRGGEATIFGVIIGAAVMRVLYNSINLLGFPSDREYVIIGLVILLGVMADESVKRLAARRRSVSEAGE